MDLTQLRSDMNVVLQNPFVIQTDSIKENLDPRRLFSDRDIENALTEAAFYQSVAATEQQTHQLQTNESFDTQDRSLESGRHFVSRQNSDAQKDLAKLANDFSVGQQQLLNLAYALLQKSTSILLLDEPTAQVDYKSQKKVLGNLFRMATERKMTVLMIAHRLETAVTYSDKVLVMDQGSVAEFDHSYKLLVDSEVEADQSSAPSRDTMFASMVRSLTPQQQARIMQLSAENYFNSSNNESREMDEQ